ncbi:hypothetical protein [Saccharibacillus sacchari]|uniref:Uncharacterized protein n=1 Tax=Saccharibacillus sacchari TaxID=456493 RepID=A0ACC6PAE0_9BACL
MQKSNRGRISGDMEGRVRNVGIRRRKVASKPVVLSTEKRREFTDTLKKHGLILSVETVNGETPQVIPLFRLSEGSDRSSMYEKKSKEIFLAEVADNPYFQHLHVQRAGLELTEENGMEPKIYKKKPSALRRAVGCITEEKAKLLNAEVREGRDSWGE